ARAGFRPGGPGETGVPGELSRGPAAETELCGRLSPPGRGAFPPAGTGDGGGGLPPGAGPRAESSPNLARPGSHPVEHGARRGGPALLSTRAGDLPRAPNPFRTGHPSPAHASQFGGLDGEPQTVRRAGPGPQGIGSDPGPHLPDPAESLLSGLSRTG